MTAHDPNLSVNSRERRSRIWQWFAGHPTQGDEGDDPAVPSRGNLREIRLSLQSPVLADIGSFLAEHDLDLLPFTLTVAYDCVTGYNQRLAEQIRERSESGQPVTLGWLEDASRDSGRNREEMMLASLMCRLEESLEEFGRTTDNARSAATDYNSALAQHVDDLEKVSKAGVVISELASLARAMMERTKSIETELSRSEKRARTLQKNLEEARRMADHDHLTGLPNRRSFEHLLEREYKNAQASGEPLSVAFCDVDLFKRINDVHGHAAGDRVLKVVAETLARISDDKCHVARHGGEEFALLFRNLSAKEARDRLDRAREELCERRLVNRATDVPFGRVSFSGGVSDVFGYRTKGQALKAADEALYMAKANGRNQVIVAGSG